MYIAQRNYSSWSITLVESYGVVEFSMTLIRSIKYFLYPLPRFMVLLELNLIVCPSLVSWKLYIGSMAMNS